VRAHPCERVLLGQGAQVSPCPAENLAHDHGAEQAVVVVWLDHLLLLQVGFAVFQRGSALVSSSSAGGWAGAKYVEDAMELGGEVVLIQSAWLLPQALHDGQDLLYLPGLHIEFRPLIQLGPLPFLHCGQADDGPFIRDGGPLPLIEGEAFEIQVTRTGEGAL